MSNPKPANAEHARLALVKDSFIGVCIKESGMEGLMSLRKFPSAPQILVLAYVTLRLRASRFGVLSPYIYLGVSKRAFDVFEVSCPHLSHPHGEKS